MVKMLLLGGTGAMGIYLVPELIRLGYDVFITTRSARKSDNSKITYIQGDAHDNEFLKKIFEDKYDAVVDFMVYKTDEFREKHELLLSNTNHYIFVSTYRVFAESNASITENSPRLLDVSKDTEYLKTDEYALTKARQENILRESRYKNWTIVRPAITYSKTRFQLGTLEADTIIVRALNSCSVVLPKEMLGKKTTMTWGGDVAKMIAKLVLNPKSFCEDYNVCTSEHRTWQEVAEYYNKLIGLKVIPTNLDTYFDILGGKNYQIIYDRMYNRVMDNSKILKTIDMQQKEILPLFDGLRKELSDEKSLQTIKPNYKICRKMDKITNTFLPKRIYLNEVGKNIIKRVLEKVKRTACLLTKVINENMRTK